jgi:hypothetical protein
MDEVKLEKLRGLYEGLYALSGAGYGAWSPAPAVVSFYQALGEEGRAADGERRLRAIAAQAGRMLTRLGGICAPSDMREMESALAAIGGSTLRAAVLLYVRYALEILEPLAAGRDDEEALEIAALNFELRRLRRAAWRASLYRWRPHPEPNA